jgi:hypothetical protein
MKSIVSIARFSTLAARFVTMRAGSSIVIQGDAHPESGAVCSVTLRYDGDGYSLDGEPLMQSPRPSRSTECPWQASIVSGGCLPWKESAKAAMALLGAKESQAAREHCMAEDERFLAANGQWAR